MKKTRSSSILGITPELEKTLMSMIGRNRYRIEAGEYGSEPEPEPGIPIKAGDGHDPAQADKSDS